MSAGPCSTRPSSHRYRKLISGLEEVDRQLASGMHLLEASILAIDVVNLFLCEDSTIQERGTSVVLRRLLANLNDVGCGMKPSVFFEGGLKDVGKPGRRTDASFDTLRGCLAAALSFLIDAGIKNADAAGKLESMLEKKHVLLRGKSITAKRLLQWREQIGDNCPERVNHAYVEAMKMKTRSGTPASYELALKEAQAVVQIVSNWNSR